MRCFTRRSGQTLRIGDDVVVTVTSVRGGSVRLGFEVPRDMIVDREEVAEQKKRERVAGNLQYVAQNRALTSRGNATGRRAQVAEVETLAAKSRAKRLPATKPPATKPATSKATATKAATTKAAATRAATTRAAATKAPSTHSLAAKKS